MASSGHWLRWIRAPSPSPLVWEANLLMQTRPLAARRYDAQLRNDQYPLRSIAISSDLFARQVPADPTMYVPPPTSKLVALVEDSGLALARPGLSADALQ